MAASSAHVSALIEEETDGNPVTTSTEVRPDSPDADSIKYFSEVTKVEPTEKETREKQQRAQFWAAFLTNIKLFFLTGLFAFFSRLQWKTFFQTTFVHYALLPLAPLFESVEVVTDAYQIAVSKKTDIKLWISLGVNLLRLGGVSLAVTLLVSGLAAASGTFATLAGSAFVFAVGVKTLFHSGMALFHFGKSFEQGITKQEKSEHRHQALNHSLGAAIALALTVSIGFVMLKGALTMAVVGSAVSFAGALIGIGLMYKDYRRKKNVEKEMVDIVKNFDDEPLLAANTETHSFRNQPELAATSSHESTSWKNPFSGLLSSLSAQFSATTPAPKERPEPPIDARSNDATDNTQLRHRGPNRKGGE